jgi:hypothetical protein
MEYELNPLQNQLDIIPDFSKDDISKILTQKILDFVYDNANKKRKCEFFQPRIPCERMKKRKIVSGKVDLELSTNLIRTNKYNSIDFVPKNLLEQFSKVANLYFLVDFGKKSKYKWPKYSL